MIYIVRYPKNKKHTQQAMKDVQALSRKMRELVVARRMREEAYGKRVEINTNYN